MNAIVGILLCARLASATTMYKVNFGWRGFTHADYVTVGSFAGGAQADPPVSQGTFTYQYPNGGPGVELTQQHTRDYGPILSGEWTNISEVIRSFPMGGGTVVLQNLCPGGQTRMRIYSHDPATNARHTNHVGIVNELLVTGGEYDANGQLVTAQLANNITLTAAGAHPGPAGLQMWDGIEMRADAQGLITIHYGRFINALELEVIDVCRPPSQSTTVCVNSTIDINFNTGVDVNGQSSGDLVFRGSAGFEVHFTDDGSSGSHGSADGVRISNQNGGNIFVGSSNNLVLGANDAMSGAETNYHSSGIVARFNQGARVVSFDDTDNDGTLKALFAFDASGALIGQSVHASQTTVIVDSARDCGGQLIYSVEFDTLPGTAGGASDGTYFTIDNFHASSVDSCTTINRGWPTVAPTTPWPSESPTFAPTPPTPPPTCQTCVAASFCGDGTKLAGGVCVPDCAVLRRRDISCPHCDEGTLTSTDDGPGNDNINLIIGIVVGISLCVVLAVVAFVRRQNDDEEARSRSVDSVANPVYEAGGAKQNPVYGVGENTDNGYLEVAAAK